MLYVTDGRDSVVVGLRSLTSPMPTLHVPSALTGSLRAPHGVTATTGRSLLVADGGNHRIVVLSRDGTSDRVLETATSPIGSLANPRGVDRGPDGRLVVADTGNHRVAFSGFFLSDLARGVADLDDWSAYGSPGSPGAAGEGQFLAPVNVHVDAVGRTLVADPGLDRLVRIDSPTGDGWVEISLPPGDRPPRPYGLATGPNGGVLVTDLVNGRVLLVDADDGVDVLIDGGADRSIIAPVGAVLDRSGIVVADAAAGQLTRWSRRSGTGKWKPSGRLPGNPGRSGWPGFAAMCGLASTGGAR